MTKGPVARDVAEYLAAVSQRIGQEAEKSFTNYWYDEEALDEMESPIEQLMSIGLAYAIRSEKSYGLGFGYSVFSTKGSPHLGEIHQKYEGFLIRPQWPIGAYRADFLVTYRHYTGAVAGAVVECDGHEFHEKTKEQAQKDKERDRYFQSLGFLILRYTGAEIFRDPIKCAVNALEIIWARADATTDEKK